MNINIPNYNIPILKDLGIFKSNEKKTYYRGSPYFSMITMMYIKNKFPESCVIIPTTYNINSHEKVSLRYNERKKKLTVPRNFWKKFWSCSNKRFIVFPFGYSCKDGSGHANIMIYDSKKMTLERFEPYGDLNSVVPQDKKKCFNPEIDEILFNFFDDKGVIKEYFPPSSFIPSNGMQKIQEKEYSMTEYDPEGFCTMWSLFYCDLRLSNPEMERKKLLEKTIKTFTNNNKSLTNFIRDYSNIISQLFK